VWEFDFCKTRLKTLCVRLNPRRRDSRFRATSPTNPRETGKLQTKANRFGERPAAVRSRVKSIGEESHQLDASETSGRHGVVEGHSSQFGNNHFTEMCSSSKAGSYVRLVYHSNLGLRVITKREEGETHQLDAAEASGGHGVVEGLHGGLRGFRSPQIWWVT